MPRIPGPPPTFLTEKTTLLPSVPITNFQPHLPSLAGRAYRCQCGCPVFFRNSACLACGTPLGYEPDQARLLPLMPNTAPDAPPDTWVAWQGNADGDPVVAVAPVGGGDTSAGYPSLNRLSKSAAHSAGVVCGLPPRGFFAFNALIAFLNRRSARIVASAESALSPRFSVRQASATARIS